tara:strand:+ start:497 stop:904 length:408 start_codon:yes stop_codon:yes gene_type:complete
MKKYKVSWSKTYYASGEVEVEATSKMDAELKVEEKIGDYEGSMQYNPDEDYIDAVEVKSVTTQMCEDVLDKARELGALSYPRDFDGAHHVKVEARKDLPYDAMGDHSQVEPSNKEQERLDKFNKDNPTDNLQDLM